MGFNYNNNNKKKKKKFFAQDITASGNYFEVIKTLGRD